MITKLGNPFATIFAKCFYRACVLLNIIYCMKFLLIYIILFLFSL